MPKLDPVVSAVPVAPGYKSSEFWLAVASQLVAALLASGLFPDTSSTVKILAFVAALLTSLGYTASRTLLKGK